MRRVYRVPAERNRKADDEIEGGKTSDRLAPSALVRSGHRVVLASSLGVESIEVELEVLEGHLHHAVVGKVEPQSAVLRVAKLEDRFAIVVELQGPEEGLDRVAYSSSPSVSVLDDAAGRNFAAAEDGRKKARSKGSLMIISPSQCGHSTSMSVSTPQSYD